MATRQRFTLDGSDALEQRMQSICDQVTHCVRELFPERKLEALVLGGGYGRGEGGVLNGPTGHQPYNDLEFYVFLKGNRLLNERAYAKAINKAADQLSLEAGIHVEFKLDSLVRLREAPISMFSFDLVSAHRVLLGNPPVFSGCRHHLEASQIPLSEATRLLMNRGSGLLLSRELLAGEDWTDTQADFVTRNLAKAQLALGDALLTAHGLYHWSCRERQARLSTLRWPHARHGTNGPLPSLAEMQAAHQAGVRFKLHPSPPWMTREELAGQLATVGSLAREVWFWLEGRRLNRPFQSTLDYARAPLPFEPRDRWRNRLLTLRTFGLRAALDPLADSYPRERLFRALPALLWDLPSLDSDTRGIVQRALQTSATDWPGLVSAYKRVWPVYG